MDILDLEMKQHSSKMDTLKEQLQQMEEQQEQMKEKRQREMLNSHSQKCDPFPSPPSLYYLNTHTLLALGRGKILSAARHDGVVFELDLSRLDLRHELHELGVLKPRVLIRGEGAVHPRRSGARARVLVVRHLKGLSLQIA